MKLSNKEISAYLQMNRTPAGAILRHILNHLNVSQADLASSTHILSQHINGLVKNTRRFSPASSLKIEAALGISSPGFFFKCQCNHDIFLAMQEQSPKPNISNLSKSTFWDVDLDNVDWSNAKNWAILRVLEYGRANDFDEISKFYGKNSFKSALATLGQQASRSMLRNASLFGLQ